MILRRFATMLIVAPQAAFAQVAGDVVVTGRGLPARPGDVAFATVSIEAERIAQTASNRLESLLTDVAGVQSFRRSDSRSANPTSQGISLRGIGGNASSRALLILDGVPQTDPFGGWVAFPAYATDRLGLVRITRGGGSGYFGAGALAGTIELESADPALQPGLAARAAAGSRDAVDASASALLRKGAGFATLSAAYARGDGFIPTVAEARGPADRPAPYEQLSVAARGVLPIGARTEVQTNLLAFSDMRERGTAFTENRSEGADASLRVIHRGRWEVSALGYVQTRAFASSFASVDANRTAATRTLDQYNTPATGVGTRLEIRPPVGTRRDLRLGADLRRVEGRTQELFSYVATLPTRRRVAGGAARTIGAFADASAVTGDLTLTLGGRIDHWRLSDGRLRETVLATGAAASANDFAERSGTEWTGRAGAAWAIGAPVTLRATAYRGWRLPTLNELYRPFRVGTDAVAANAALAPERLDGADVGMRVVPVRGVSIDATGFVNRLTGAIANVTAGRGPGTFPGVGFVAAGGTYRVRRNLDAIDSRGVEVDARMDAGALFAIASLSHVAPRVRASGTAVALDGLRPAQTPLTLVSATLGWRRDAASVSATLRHSAAQFDDDANSRVLAAATTLDAYAALPVTRALAFEVRAENLTDTRVEAGVSGAAVIERATPRTLWIGLRLRVD